MKTVIFDPWVGSDYGFSDIKLLILGESHHGGCNPPDATKIVVEEWLSGVTNRPYRFFTHLAVALTNGQSWSIDRKEAFRNVAFYNDVTAVMDGPRISPAWQQFTASEPAFREVLDFLRPTHIVVCGHRLWNSLPPFDDANSDGYQISLSGVDVSVGRYRTEHSSPLAMRMIHPQSGRFSGKIWHPRINLFLQER